MKSLVYRGMRDIRFEDVADPTISAPRNAIVKISACGICGSDLHPYHLEVGHSFCIGHEAVGEVVETGSEVSRFKVGQRVLIPGSINCGECGACRQSLSMQCERFAMPRVFGQGFPGIGGCQAEAVEVPDADATLFELPSDMSDGLGIMLTDSLPTAWVCAKRGNIRPGGDVAVIGLGAVGLQCVLAAFAQGAERVFAIDLVADRRDEAAKLGAVPVDPSHAMEMILGATAGLGVPTVLEAVGGPQTAELAVGLAAKGGTVSIVGVAEATLVPFPVLFALAKNLDIRFVSCSVQAQLPELFQAIATGRLDTDVVEGLITHYLPLREGPAAYAMFDAKASGVKKILLTT